MKALLLCFLVLANSAFQENFIDQALANPARAKADLERDATSKPKQVLGFAGLQPGMKVADIFAGAGYYSEILSAAVGPQGKVICQNNEPWIKFLGPEKSPTRLEKLPNVSVLVTETSNLDLPKELDLIMIIMGYHDTYYVDEGWPKVDNKSFCAQLLAALKPNGKLLIVDHEALDGTGHTSAQSMHRIEKAFVIKDFQNAGFVFEKESALLENTSDPRNITVFDPSIRGKTSQMLLLFKKP